MLELPSRRSEGKEVLPLLDWKGEEGDRNLCPVVGGEPLEKGVLLLVAWSGEERGVRGVRSWSSGVAELR